MSATSLTLELPTTPTKNASSNDVDTDEAAAATTSPGIVAAAAGALERPKRFSFTSNEEESALTLMSPTTPTSAATSPSFLPEMPQWKKDLIQRRKTNVARTLGAQSPLQSPQQRFAGHEGDGFSSPTKDFTLKSTQYTTKVNNNKNITATTTTSSSSIATVSSQQYGYTNYKITAEDQQQQQLQQRIGIAKTNLKATTTTTTKKPATNTAVEEHEEEEEGEKVETDVVDPLTATTTTTAAIKATTVISPTKEETTAEIFIGGHYTPQVSTTTTTATATTPDCLQMDPNVVVAVATLADVDVEQQEESTIAPIPKQRSLFLATATTTTTAPASAKEDSCSNSSFSSSSTTTSSSGGGATSSFTTANEQNTMTTNVVEKGTTTTRLTSSSATTTTINSTTTTIEQQQAHQQIVKTNLGKSSSSAAAAAAPLKGEEVDEKMHNAEVNEGTKTATSPYTNQYIDEQRSSYSPLTSPQHLQSTNVGEQSKTKSTGALAAGYAGKQLQSNLKFDSDNKSSVTGTSSSVNSVLLSSTTITTSTVTSPTKKKIVDSEKIKISSKLQSNQFIKNQKLQQEQQQQQIIGCSTVTTNKYIKHKKYTATITQESSAANTTTATTTAAAAVAAANSKKKMVAVQEMKKTTSNQNQHIIGSNSTTTTCGVVGRQQQTSPAQQQQQDVTFDPSEDLSYGPGIVSKLRCRYLSLALRESMEKQRHALDTLRRATSLNNLLDRDDQHKDDEDDDDDEEDDVDEDVADHDEIVPVVEKTQQKYQHGILKSTTLSQQEQQDTHAVSTKKTATFQQFATPAAAVAAAPPAQQRMSQSQMSNVSDTALTPRSRHGKRGNDSLKRARSVEALLCEKSPWNFAFNRTSLDTNKKQQQQLQLNQRSETNCVSIEDKISNARERLILGTDSMPPKRLTSIIDDTERPPPDLVKQTLKKFEATANRRGRNVQRANGNGAVANKVANYRSIIKEQKPAILFPKPPSSPTKKIPIVASTGGVSVTKPAMKPAVAAADLIGSPIGRKTAATAANIISPLPMTPDIQNASTPKQQKQRITSTTTAAATVGLEFSTPTSKTKASSMATTATSTTGLSSNTPDIIPSRHKLLLEKAQSEKAVVVDSPVTALTKKLEKLSVDTPPQKSLQQQQQQQINVTTKESEQNNAVSGSAVISLLSDEFVGGDARTSNGNKNEASAIVDVDVVVDSIVDDEYNNDKSHANRDHRRRRRREAESFNQGTESTSSDRSDDEYGRTKRVTKSALENIAKAGTSQQFKFVTAGGNKPEEIPAKQLNVSIAGGKQIGVIRPLLNSNSNPTTYISSVSASSSSSNSNTSSTSIANSIISLSSGESFAHEKPTSTQSNNQQHMEATLKQQQLYSHNTHTSIQTHTLTQAIHSHPALTSREIEKNRINEMKKIAPAATTDLAAAAAIASATVASTTLTATSLDTVIVTKTSSSSGGLSELDAAATITHNSSPLWALQTKKKRQPPAAVAENNSMVFNFSNRKEVPDYIENDGVVIRRKRELPKPNESGFVLLGDLSLETSTDSDYDDFSLCPPSPCDVEFENANIVIDGKSSIRQKPKEASFRVQFNDTLTSTFEYPSEASLIVDEPSVHEHYGRDNFVNAYQNLVLEPAISTTDSPKHHHHVAVDEIIPLPINTTTTTNNSSSSPTTKMLGNLPLGSAPLGYYTPVKAPLENLFQLGVTRAPANNNSNGISHSKTNKNSKTNCTQPSTATMTNGISNRSNSDSGSGGGDGQLTPPNKTTMSTNENEDEPESLQYLKPANDDLTIAYSEGTQKTDLLY